MSVSQNSLFSIQLYKQKVEDCFNIAQEQIEVSSKSSYNKISQSIDQILLDSIHPCLSNFQFLSTSPQFIIQSPSIFTNEYIHSDLTNQIKSELQPSINSIVQRELKIKEQKFNKSLDKEIEERKREYKRYEEIIKNKDFEIPKINLKQNIEEKENKQIKEPQNLNPFTFEIINQNTIKQNEWCQAIAFNKDCSIVVAGCDKNIKVFQHRQGKLDQIQILSEHRYNVYTLNFMKNTNNFVSGSHDNSIIIWQEIGNSQWKCQQILNGHSNPIYCLQLNNTDDLIISGSLDNTIKFWMKQVNWMCQQTITDHTQQVYSLSLNDQQNKLISCSFDSQILVIEQQKLDNKWNVTQKIKVDTYGLRLCFISDNQFIFQPKCQKYMDIYEMDSNTKQYSKTKQIAVKYGSGGENILFPQQYLKSKCILVNKNGTNVNLMRKKENDDFIIQQYTEFNHKLIFGQLSDDGEYLITWDDKSKEIQIRKFRQL
ncbi:unnamed protein product [Paramecium pentaurelia]|uniref:WD40-repeat-containing domain n=1 Tax=Paramecium pentaurelia TaxID=43138 RepID=A0A8S1UYT0_9CILI|nr:unnamed protein product [Paramecium pentaurelia]